MLFYKRKRICFAGDGNSSEKPWLRLVGLIYLKAIMDNSIYTETRL